MARKERVSRGKQLRPNYFVFCEGETEVAYVALLRSTYHVPIHVISKKTLLNITPQLVKRCEAAYIATKHDRTFLMYDLDVPTVLTRLQKIPEATLLCSNPCFELWLLLHHADQTAALNSADCVTRLKKSDPRYAKGQMVDTTFYLQHVDRAIARAKTLQAYNNPSTTVYRLVELLQTLEKAE